MEKYTDTPQTTQILQAAPIGVLTSDSNDKITWANKKSEDIFGQSLKALVNKNIHELVQANTDHSVIQQESIKDTIYITATSCQQAFWLKRVTSPLEPENIQAGNVHFFIDITEFKTLQNERNQFAEQIKDLATIDPHTGLLTQRAIMQNLDPLVSRCRRYNNPLTVIMMDIQNLSQQVGNLGQFQPNQILLATGQLLKDQMRWADLISRTKEDAFVLILPETMQNDALVLVKKIQSKLKKLAIPYDTGTEVQVDTTFGLTQWQKGDDVRMLLQRVKEALKSAQQSDNSITSI